MKDTFQSRVPTDIGLSGWWAVAKRTVKQMSADHVTLAAGGVAFYGFLSLIPALVAVVSIYGLVADPSDIDRMIANISDALPESAAELLRDQLTSIVKGSDQALGLGVIIGVASSVWSASSGMGKLIEALNIAYDEENEGTFIGKRVKALALSLAGFVSIGMAVVVLRLGAITNGIIFDIVGWVLIGVIFAGLLAVLYRYAPARDEPEWVWVSIGSVVAIMGLIAMTFGFQFYVANFGSYNETYGSLGAVVILLYWLFLSAAIVIVGAELNAEAEHQTAADTTSGPDEPIGERDAYVADNVAASGD